VRNSFLPALAALVAFATTTSAQTGTLVVVMPAADTGPVATAGSPIAAPVAPLQREAAPSVLPAAPQPMGTTPSGKPVAPAPMSAPGSTADGPVVGFNPEQSASRGLWFSADYLVWWVRSGPTGGPLVTTGAVTDAVPGGLGSPNTMVEFGDSRLDFGNFSGMRFRAGLPLGPLLSVEGAYFLLEQRAVHFGINSDAGGNPLLTRPAVSADTGGPITYSVSFPGALAGAVAIDARTRLQGAEVNLAGNVVNDNTVRFDVLGGLRGLDLAESLQISEGLTPLAASALTFNGAGVTPPGTVSLFDSFRAANHFYGGQLGGRLDWQRDGVCLTIAAKVAMGVTQQTVTIDGGSTLLTPGAAPVFAPGGILAQPTNIGLHSRTAFSVVPEAGLEFGYQIRPWMRATVGYTFLYWSAVARPGNQIDHTISFIQVPTDPSFGTGSPATHPALPSVRDSGFWAQGANFSLTFSY
jgi:hypothetical protein